MKKGPYSLYDPFVEPTCEVSFFFCCQDISESFPLLFASCEDGDDLFFPQ